MEWHKLKKFIKHIHSHPLFEQKRSLLLVFTNGLLLDSNKLDFFKKFGVSVALSFDGTKKTQDLNRKTITPRDNGSFKKILQNISLFSETQKNDITINSVTTPKTCLDLTKNLKFIRRLGFKKIDFYPTYQWWKTDQLKKLSYALKQFEDHYVGAFNANKKEQVFMIPSLYSILAKKQWGDDKLTKCSELRLSPEGSFFTCEKFFSLPPNEREKWSIGNVNGPINEGLKMKILGQAWRYFKNKFPNHKFIEPYFCPLSFYFWGKINGQDPASLMAVCLKITDIYRKFMLSLINKLHLNPLFKEMYNIK